MQIFDIQLFSRRSVCTKVNCMPLKRCAKRALTSHVKWKRSLNWWVRFNYAFWPTLFRLVIHYLQKNCHKNDWTIKWQNYRQNKTESPTDWAHIFWLCCVYANTAHIELITMNFFLHSLWFPVRFCFSLYFRFGIYGMIISVHSLVLA